MQASRKARRYKRMATSKAIAALSRAYLGSRCGVNTCWPQVFNITCCYSSLRPVANTVGLVVALPITHVMSGAPPRSPARQEPLACL